MNGNLVNSTEIIRSHELTLYFLWNPGPNYFMTVIPSIYRKFKDYGLARKEPDAFWSVDCVMRSIGDGTLNWNAILETAEKCGVEWFVVEHDGNCPDPFASFQTSLEFLKKHFVTA